MGSKKSSGSPNGGNNNNDSNNENVQPSATLDAGLDLGIHEPPRRIVKAVRPSPNSKLVDDNKNATSKDDTDYEKVERFTTPTIKESMNDITEDAAERHKTEVNLEATSRRRQKKEQELHNRRVMGSPAQKKEQESYNPMSKYLSVFSVNQSKHKRSFRGAGPDPKRPRQQEEEEVWKQDDDASKWTKLTVVVAVAAVMVGVGMRLWKRNG